MRTNERKSIPMAVGAVLLFCLMVLQAPVASTNPLPQVIGAFNGVFFRNSEVLIDHEAPGEPGHGEISVGDTFWGVLEVDKIVAPSDSQGQTGSKIWGAGIVAPPVEITGYFATAVVDIIFPPNGADATNPTIVLGPVTDPNGILGPGEVMRIFEDTVVNYDDSTQGKALAGATDGTPLGSFVMAGGYWYTIAPTAIPDIGGTNVGKSYGGLNESPANPFPFPFGPVNDPNEVYSDGSGTPGGLNVDYWFNSELYRLSLNPDLTLGPNEAMHFGSNDPAVYFPRSEEEIGACRMTGGNATVSPAIGFDDTETWTYSFLEPVDQSFATGYWITTGGQINAPSGNNPPSGHWVHAQHGGAEGNFSFHAGTSSAPDGTEISTVECADPGWCVQARCAGFKQLFWTGIGNFANQHFDAVFPGCEVIPTRGNQGSQHYVRVMIGDFGENDRPTREAALQDADPDTCNWFDKLQGAGYPGPPGPYTAADAVFLDSAADGKFGNKGGQVCDKCPDYYQIEIHCTTDPASAVIYDFQGFLESGNYQIHPETGTQCPVIEELVPELFQTTTKGNGKNK